MTNHKKEKKVDLQVGVKILLKNKEGKYLLLRRSAKKYPEVGDSRWDIVGGRINPGVTLIENLRREVKEETDLKLIGEPHLVAAQDILRIPARHVVRLTYIGEAGGEIRIDSDEHDDYKWYTKEEMEQLEGVDMYFRDLLKKNILV